MVRILVMILCAGSAKGSCGSLDLTERLDFLSGSLVPLSVVEGLAHDRVPGHALDVDVGYEGVRSLSKRVRC